MSDGWWEKKMASHCASVNIPAAAASEGAERWSPLSFSLSLSLSLSLSYLSEANFKLAKNNRSSLENELQLNLLSMRVSFWFLQGSSILILKYSDLNQLKLIISMVLVILANST